MTDFSVLMSVYAKEKSKYLQQSIDSIFYQSLLPSEVILMEDGPLTKELYHTINELKAKYPLLKTIPLKENHGLGYALNIGLQHCTYNLVARMDTDDICKPDRFKKQISLFEQHPEIDVTSSSIDEFYGDINHIISRKMLPESHDDIVKYAKKRCPENHPTVVYKRDKVVEAGGYIGFPEDYYLWVRMILKGCHFHNISESLLWFRTSPYVYKRRGGWNYAKKEILFQWKFYKIGFLTFPRFLLNSSIRLIARLVPNSMRTFIYNKIIRKIKYI